MVNTVKSTTILSGAREATVYFTLASDGTNETDLVIYDSSAVAALLTPPDTDPLTSAILNVYGSVSAASTARAILEWDANTDVLAFNLPAGQSPTKANFKCIGGLPNQASTGITGDITLTTTGLASGDSIVIVLTVKRK